MKKLRTRSANFVGNNSKLLKKLTPKNILIVSALLILAITQIYSFKNEGEILGFQVKKVSTKQGLKGVPDSAKDETKDSLVCKTVSAEFVADLVNTKELQKSTLYKDVKTGDLTSNSTCIYRTDSKVTKMEDKRVVSVSFQEKSTQEPAEKEAQRLKEKEDVQTVEDFQDEAYYSEKSSQLTVRKDNKVVNVFINVAPGANIDKQDTAKKIAEKLLN